ncbi:hypothetical protein NP493_888g00013 [Ridgeia piscesae]|uniref:Uncharacterized protein n=1 Tax=Ridgeia piscesae TaxID=27915 RepID=A0AAD9KKK3_RIDPI|nr:hypothetical protein NP493_888g00013 [Ridgeia piscesae]
MSACSLRHLTRTYSPVRMYGRYVHKLVFLFVAVFIVLNVLYILPFTSDSTNLLVARSAAEQVVDEQNTLAVKPGENVLEIKSTLAPKPGKCTHCLRNILSGCFFAQSV